VIDGMMSTKTHHKIKEIRIGTGIGIGTMIKNTFHIFSVAYSFQSVSPQWQVWGRSSLCLPRAARPRIARRRSIIEFGTFAGICGKMICCVLPTGDSLLGKNMPRGINPLLRNL
jgi:hypothetical protein